MSNGIGYLFCLLAACANGTFGVLHRQVPNLDNEIFVLYCMTLGLAPVCVLTAALLPALSMTVGFTGWGLLSGLVGAFMQFFVFTLIGQLGVAMTIGIYAAGGILLSVAADLAFFHRRPTSPGMLVFALFLVLVGIFIIVVSKLTSPAPPSSSEQARVSQGGTALVESAQEKGGELVGGGLQPVHDDDDFQSIKLSDAPPAPQGTAPHSVPASALASAPSGAGGCTLGSVTIMMCILVPPCGLVALNALQSLAPAELRGLPYDWSFGIGAGVSTLFLTPPAYVIMHGRLPTAADLGSPRDARYAGYSGALLGVAFACLDIGIGSGLSLGIANTIFQGAIFVGGLWGIIVYEEIRGRDSIGLFCIGVVTMFTGIVLEAITRV